jgi:hypothetical protein
MTASVGVASGYSLWLLCRRRTASITPVGEAFDGSATSTIRAGRLTLLRSRPLTFLRSSSDSSSVPAKLRRATCCTTASGMPWREVRMAVGVRGWPRAAWKVVRRRPVSEREWMGPYSSTGLLQYGEAATMAQARSTRDCSNAKSTRVANARTTQGSTAILVSVVCRCNRYKVCANGCWRPF